MDIWHIVLNTAVFFGVLLFLDWAMPTRVRAIAFGAFKTEFDPEKFYPAYRKGFPLRLGIALILTAIMAGVLVTRDEVAWAFTLVPSVAGYSALICYHMWLADRRPEALNKRGRF